MLVVISYVLVYDKVKFKGNCNDIIVVIKYHLGCNSFLIDILLLEISLNFGHFKPC